MENMIIGQFYYHISHKSMHSIVMYNLSLSLKIFKKYIPYKNTIKTNSTKQNMQNHVYLRQLQIRLRFLSTVNCLNIKK